MSLTGLTILLGKTGDDNKCTTFGLPSRMNCGFTHRGPGSHVVRKFPQEFRPSKKKSAAMLA
jgi:hypothetical protein